MRVARLLLPTPATQEDAPRARGSALVRGPRIGEPLVMLRASLLVGLMLSLAPALARADVISPAVAECQSKTAGAACSDAGNPGQCAVSRCSKLDYSQGVPPRSVEYDCLECKPAPTPADVAPAPEPAQPKAADSKAGPPVSESRCAVDPATGSLGLLVGVFAALRGRRRRVA